MIKYNKEEMEILERVYNDYNIIKKDIDDRIKKGYDIENLLNYIRHLSSCSTTNINLDDDLKYVDFNYCDMCLSIYEDKNKTYLGEDIEIWNDKKFYCIGEIGYNDLKKILHKDLIGLYATRNNGNLYEIKVNCATYENDFDGKYYLFINGKFIRAYKYKKSLTEYVRINYDTILMI